MTPFKKKIMIVEVIGIRAKVKRIVREFLKFGKNAAKVKAHIWVYEPQVNLK